MKKTKQQPAKIKKKVKKPETKKKIAKKKDTLTPLLFSVIVLFILICYLSFSDRFLFLSDIFSKDKKESPLIERPQIEHTDLEDLSEDESNGFAVTTEIEVKAESVIPAEELPVPANSIKSRLFYVKVSDEGQISLKSVIRTVNYSSKPLTETIKSLIIGPERSELNKGLLNLIPKGTQLISIVLSNGTALLNFNEEYRFNSLGIEGYKAQLMQTIYTATEFSSVKKVQILINGEKLDYLGAEGIYIGEPLDREYFQ